MTTIKIHRGDNTNAFNGGLLTITKNNDEYSISKVEVNFGKVIKTYANPEFPLVVNVTSEETALNSTFSFPLLVTIYDTESRKLLIKTDITIDVVKSDVEIDYLPYPSPVLNISDYFPTSGHPEPPEPGHEKKGDFYFNNDTGAVYVWNGSSWIEIAYEGTCHASIADLATNATNADHATTADTATLANSASSVEWSNVDNKPSTFSPSPHTHSGADITSQVSSASSADSAPWSGITNKPETYTPSAHTHGNSDITGIDGSKITSGIIDLDRIPAGAVERLIDVDNEQARYALSKINVQNGDTVHQLDTNVMYRVIDDNNLDNANGYREYTAGRASAVPWSGVENKPESYTPSSHLHGNISNDGKIGSTANKPLITGSNGVVETGSFGNTANTFCEGNDSRLSDPRNPLAHTHSGNDITSKVASAETADTATTLGSSTVGSSSNPIYLNNGVPTACTLTTSVVTELPSTPDSNTIYIVVEEDEPVSLNMSRGLNLLQENSVEPIEESEIEEVEPVVEEVEPLSEEEPETVEPVIEQGGDER